MGQFDFQFQNVGGGSGATQAANSATNIQNQAADRISKSFEMLGELGSAKAERDESEFNTLAEKNLQKELNLIKQLDSVDDVEDYQLDEDVLREKYGNAFGGESFEQGVGALNSAVDAELTNELGKEQSMATRKIRLDKITQDDLISKYEAETDGQTTDQKRDGFAKWLVENGVDAPAGTAKAGRAAIMAADRDAEGKTIQQQRADQVAKNAADANVIADQRALTKMETQYEKQGGARVSKEITGGDLETYVSEKLTKDKLPIDSWFRDENGEVDKETLMRHTAQGTEALEQIFAERNEELKAQVMDKIKADMDFLPPSSPEYADKAAELARVEANKEGLKITGPILDSLLTMRNLDTNKKNFWNILGGGELSTDHLKKFLDKEIDRSGSPINQAIVQGYGNQADNRKLAKDIEFGYDALSKAEQRAITSKGTI